MDKLNRNIVKILKLNIDSTPKERVLRTIRIKIEKFSKKSELKAIFYITTPNPEQAVLAEEDSEFAEIINSSEFALADGIGLALAYKFFSLPKTNKLMLKPILYFAQGLGIGFSSLFDRDWIFKDGLKIIRGRDFFIDLIKLSNKMGWKVFFLGNKQKSAQKAKLVLQKSYFNANFHAESGPDLDNDGKPLSKEEKLVEDNLIDKINKISPELLFIGFGAPKQEKWLYRNINNLNTGAGMVVGGTFDYIIGKKKIPPGFVSDMGLEWLWRLAIGDQKVKRIIKAFPQFAWKIFIYKCKN